MTVNDSDSESAVGLEPLLLLGEVSQLLRISESGIYRLIRSGDLPVVRLGGRTLVRPGDLRTFIDARTTTQTSSPRTAGAGA